MKQIEVKKSVEGGKYRKVIMDCELFTALSEYNKANDVFNYLMFNGLLELGSKTYNHFNQTIENCNSIFRKYNLDKYDVRADYIFDEAIEIEK